MAVSPDHPYATRRGVVSYLADQARLADSRLAGNDHQSADAFPRHAQSSAQDRQLALASDENILYGAWPLAGYGGFLPEQSAYLSSEA
jgi:hypothetical protein